jgi:serine/threonine protein kinase
MKRLDRRPTDTGSCFSTGYLVERKSGERGFLKAVDYIRAFQAQDTAMAMKAIADAFVFERELCEKCRVRAMGEVVHAIDNGNVIVVPGQDHTKVSYLIFDLADGDIRRHLAAQDRFDLVFVLRTAHNVAVGLDQLHRADMAHQDLKPSNVLVFQKEGKSKICDLGRAWARGVAGPHDELAFAGDMGYAPPEVYLGIAQPDEMMRRFGFDMYHLGSLVVFLFTGVHVNGLLATFLRRGIVLTDGETNVHDQLPYYQAAFAESLVEFGRHVHGSVREDLTRLVSQLCEPDPRKRGHPRNPRGTPAQFSLERYVSWLNLLAFRAAVFLSRGSA